MRVYDNPLPSSTKSERFQVRKAARPEGVLAGPPFLLLAHSLVASLTTGDQNTDIRIFSVQPTTDRLTPVRLPI